MYDAVNRTFSKGMWSSQVEGAEGRGFIIYGAAGPWDDGQVTR